jgi:hypothetical protein
MLEPRRGLGAEDRAGRVGDDVAGAAELAESWKVLVEQEVPELVETDFSFTGSM